MDRVWYWKVGLIGAITLMAVYFLVPSYYYFQLPPETRNDAEVYEAAVPGWAPAKKKLNLGLDLQGGIHLVMQVDLDKAVRDMAQRRADELKTALTETKKIEIESAKALPKQARILIKPKGDMGALRKALEDQNFFGDLRVVGEEQGGLVVAYNEATLQSLKRGTLEQAIKSIRNRVDKFGVTEPTIAPRGIDSIIVQLPGFKDPEKAKELVGRTAQLEFKMVDDEDKSLAGVTPLPEGVTLQTESVQGPSDIVLSVPYLEGEDREKLVKAAEGKLPEGLELGISRVERAGQKTIYRTFVLKEKTELTGDAIANAFMDFDNSPEGMGRPVVSLRFNQRGAAKFEEITGNNIRKRMAIVLDGNIDSAPVIQSRIAGGNAQISMGGMRSNRELQEDARDLAIVLKAGALPAPVRVAEERSVGASLGPELIRKGAIAAAIGIVLVLVFMALYYGVAGLIADVALVLNGVLVLSVMAIFGATLTLPGIAGFVLTLGMAIDANVLINERIREELDAGKTLRAAVDTGYTKAFSAIFDSNLTTLVAAFILYQFGSGPIKGFAVTLSLGILCSLFTSIVVTRAIFDWLVIGRKLQRLSY